MSYQVNGKNLAVGRLMVRGKEGRLSSEIPSLRTTRDDSGGTERRRPGCHCRSKKVCPFETFLYPQEAIDAIKRPTTREQRDYSVTRRRTCSDRAALSRPAD
jgi:hypothetical protein